jgi:hypothetical protein
VPANFKCKVLCLFEFPPPGSCASKERYQEANLKNPLKLVKGVLTWSNHIYNRTNIYSTAKFVLQVLKHVASVQSFFSNPGKPS